LGQIAGAFQNLSNHFKIAPVAFSSGIEVLGTEAMKQLDVQRRRRGLRKLLSRPGQRHKRQKQLKSKLVRCAHQGRRRLLPFTNNFRRAVRPASTILDYI